MQRLLQLLHYSLAFVVIWSAGMLAAAEGGPIPLISIPLAMLTVMTVDRWNLWHVNVSTANVLGVIAFFVSGYEFLLGDLERRVITAGHVLTYLTCIFLVQRKQSKQMWLLLAMSVLEVAVASILTSDPWLGPALLLYVMAALWTLSVFSLYRAGKRVSEHTSLNNGKVSWTPAPTGSRLRHGVRAEQSSWVNSRFVAGGLTTTFLAMVLAVGFFLFIPRMWISGVAIRGDDTQPLTGFAETVSLGDVGELMESTDLVFDVEFHPFNSDVALTPTEVDNIIRGEPMYRGSVLEQYSNGRWTLGRDRELVRGFPVAPPDRRRLLVQTFRLQPIGTKVLFTVGFPVGAIDNHPVEDSRIAEIFLDKRSFEIHRRSPVGREMLTYRVYSMTEGQPPQTMTLEAEIRRRAYLTTLLQVPDSLTPLGDFAAEVVGTRRPRTTRQLDAAQRIEKRLRDSTDFTYSMKNFVKDPKVDPLVDFVVNRKSGHCEYYASAMTMMLRSLSIPARMISGFKGGQYNVQSGRYEVRQLHAHTWVEAFVDDQWQKFDPTPGMRDLSVQEKEEAHNNSTLATLLDTSKSLWGQSMQMTKDQQQEFLYRPIRDRMTFVWNIGTGVLSGQISPYELVQNAVRRPDRWFSWQGGVTTIVIGLLLVLLTRVGRSILRWMRGARADKSRGQRTRLTIEFYERMMRILREAGFEPQPSQTAREFVDATMKRLPTGGPTDPETRELVEWFYDVRFGGGTLAPAQVAQIDQRLQKLEAALLSSSNAQDKGARK